MNTLPVAEVRAQLSRLVDEAERTHERLEITRNGRRAAVLLGADDYDELLETLSALSSPDLLADHTEGERALAAGEGITAEELAERMRAAGRLPS